MAMPNYSRRDFLKSIGVGAAALALPGCMAMAQSPQKNPNFIIVLVDDMGWADTGCYGSKFYETPNINRLASQGMLFTNGYAACAVCSPSRAAILTGRYPVRHGLTNWISWNFEMTPGKKNPEGYTDSYFGKPTKLICPENHLWMELDEMTIAEALKPAGYVSCHVGKWHLGPKEYYPDTQGFDYNIGGCDLGAPPTYFDPYRNMTQYAERGVQGIPTLEPRKKGEYLTDRESDEACNFIRNHKDKPFFLYMAHYAVHAPIEAKEELIEKYKAKKPDQQNNPIYAAMVESVDQAIGRIMTTLDELNLTDNTVIVFTSDNGGPMISGHSYNGQPGPTNNAPLRSGKGRPYEGGIREPFIIKWPGVVKAGTVCSVPVIGVDLFPTICQAAGVRQPVHRAIDGEDLMPLLTQAGPLKRDSLYWHYPHYWVPTPDPSTTPYSIIRCGDWKLIKYYEDNSFELFNLKEDISEKNDLSVKMPEKVRELDAKLSKWLKETNAKLPKPNPNYKPSDAASVLK
jgi:arylsulfatase A